MTSATLTFDYTLFITQFPAFSNVTLYPQATIEMYWGIATFYISDNAVCGSLTGSARQYAINLMTAHLIYLAGLVAAGQTPGVLQNATVDKVTVGLQPPKDPNQWQWWLNGSPYGAQLLALLQVASAGGYYIPGGEGLAGFSRILPFAGCC
jgi:hypothetical protein